MTDTTPAQSQQAEPLFWYRPSSDGGYEGPIPHSSIEEVRKNSGAWHPLYAHPAPQPLKRAVTYVCPVCAASLERME